MNGEEMIGAGVNDNVNGSVDTVFCFLFSWPNSQTRVTVRTGLYQNEPAQSRIM